MTHNVLLRTLRMRYDQRTTILRKKNSEEKYTAEIHQQERVHYISHVRLSLRKC